MCHPIVEMAPWQGLHLAIFKVKTITSKIKLAIFKVKTSTSKVKMVH